jgi:hypothetical protein
MAGNVMTIPASCGMPFVEKYETKVKITPPSINLKNKSTGFLLYLT